MPRPLHLRLALVLIALLALAGSGFFASTLATTRQLQREIDARLHHDLAWNIASSEHGRAMLEDDSIRDTELDSLFHWLMVINPRTELYLLDTDGRIVAFHAPPGSVQLERVSMMPIQTALYGGGRQAVYGDDPRRPDRQTIFSAAPLPVRGAPRRYLYIVLDSERADGVTAMLRSSFALRLGFATALGAVALAALIGALAFHRLTKPLRRLADEMRRFGRRGRRADGAQGDDEAHGGDEVRDLETSFAQLRQRIEDQIADRERLERDRRELVANISHDLRTPLASLQGYLETLMLKGKALDDEQRETYLTTALRQAERLGKRVGELFELTRLETAAALVAREPFSITELVQDNVQRFALQAKQAGVALEARYDRALPWVVGDLGLIERVLENLIDNALRHTEAGGRVTVGLEHRDGRVMIAVRDTGRGIAPERLPKIFQRYYHARGDGTGAGTGLGLAISQRIVALHGGELEVSSTVGVGTEFRFGLQQS